jgi:Ser/Thr protein kinase RdoA (MazF antagonist)
MRSRRAQPGNAGTSEATVRRRRIACDGQGMEMPPRDSSIDPTHTVGLAELARSFGLGSIRNVALAAHGTASHVYQLETSSGSFIVKAHPEAQLSQWKQRQLRREFAVLRFLGQEKFPYAIPRPLANDRGEETLSLSGRLHWVYERIAGIHPQAITPPFLAEVAKLVATYSIHMRSFVLSDGGEFPATGNLGSELARLGPPIAPATPAAGGRPDAAMAASPDVLARAARFLDGCSFGGDRVMAHSDFHGVNLLLADSGSVVALLDFGSVQPAPRAWDLADAITQYCYDHHALNVDRMNFLVQHCTRIDPLTEDELAMIGPAILYKYFMEFRHFAAGESMFSADAKQALIERAIGRMRDMLPRL